MQEIKFKVWEKSNKIMSKPFTIVSLMGDSENFNKFLSGDPETLLFIGLKDKNDNEIYEKDVYIHSWNEHKEQFIVEDMGFKLKTDLNESGGVVEVIGNLYENPELIK